jgi:putative colanic acid biosynthesis UDP-glucose lipid carrier transferase
MAWWIWVSFLSLVLGRQTVRAILIVVRRMGLLRRRVAVVGTGPLADGIVHRMTTEMSHDDFELIGTIDPAANTFRHHVSGATATSEDFVLYVQEHGLDLLVVALPWSRSQEIYALVHRLQWIAADVVVPFDAGGLRPSFAPPLAFVDGPVLQLMHRPFKGSQGLIKAVEDYVVASIELLLVSPIMALAALAIKLEGKGPIIFKQPRVGFNSKPFMIYKFRSMTVDPTDDGSRQATKGDQRVTRVGAFLRKTSIDELPQLINVLRGEMSIVGPRPHVSNMQVGGTGVYSEIVQQYAARHRIKPGITGWAQINGMRGGIETLEKATRGAELDLHYVANWSPKLDLEIMIRTVVAGLVGRNVF